jgi:hypothetical protein
LQSSKLNDWFIGLAQATSHELWREACLAYANQLIKEEEVLKGKIIDCIFFLLLFDRLVNKTIVY